MDIERKSVVKPTGGTLRWTAPEVLLGNRISFASDGQYRYILPSYLKVS